MIEGRSYSVLAANRLTWFRQFLFLDAKKSAKMGLREGAEIRMTERMTALKRSDNMSLLFFLRTITRRIYVYVCTWKIPSRFVRPPNT